MRRPILLVLTLVPLLASCDRSFALFPFSVDTGTDIVEIPLRERPGRPPEDEGTIEPGGGLHLELDRPVRVEGDAAEIVAGFSSVPRGVEMTVLDDAGEPVTSVAVAASFNGVDADVRVAAAVRVPGESTVAGIRFSAASGGARVRLEHLRLQPSSSGAGTAPSGRGALNRASGLLHASPGLTIESWGTGGWAVDAGADERWDPLAPVEIRYRFERGASSQEDEGPAQALLTVGARRFELDLRPGANRAVFYPRVEGVPAQRIRIEPADSAELGASQLTVEWIGPAGVSADLPAPVPVDMGTLMRYPVELWRQPDFELFSWTLYPSVLIVDSASYEIQSRFFKRLAFFVEKVGYRGELLTDEQLVGRHGYNAHNYNAEGLAGFFTAVAERGIDLTAEERLLREIVVEAGIIARDGEGYAPVTG
ncbi:MAG: hypothetical protein ACOC2D_21155, partial [Spirochaetota bacterium]